MPTDIYFAGGYGRVQVDEDPGQVAQAFTSADGRPFRLTSGGGRGEVYINPGLVAFWGDSDPDPSEEQPLELEEPPIQRNTVTDIWGNPLRKRPRR